MAGSVNIDADNCTVTLDWVSYRLNTNTFVYIMGMYYNFADSFKQVPNSMKTLPHENSSTGFRFCLELVKFVDRIPVPKAANMLNALLCAFCIYCVQRTQS
jgi:hypothetical protein